VGAPARAIINAALFMPRIRSTRVGCSSANRLARASDVASVFSSELVSMELDPWRSLERPHERNALWLAAELFPKSSSFPHSAALQNISKILVLCSRVLAI